jgi:hypothetical protein
MFRKRLWHYRHAKHKRTWDLICWWLRTPQRETKNIMNRIKSYRDEKKKCVKEGDQNDWYLSTKTGKKWKWQNCKNRKNHLVTAGVWLCCLIMEWSNCLSLKEKLFVATSSYLTLSSTILHLWLECLLLWKFLLLCFNFHCPLLMAL